jgi:hypothetical protein
MRLKCHHTAWHTTVRGFVFQQGEHRLVASVDTVKIANGESTLTGSVWVVKTAKYLHDCFVFYSTSWGSIVTELDGHEKTASGAVFQGQCFESTKH